ncbi:MAG: hypothetical protein FWD64_12815 [Acidobacteriaceae bacterium]|nr:hypothetical protein [Acidobacteriaceae bacterium]
MKSFVLTLVALASLSTVALAQAKSTAPLPDTPQVQLGVTYNATRLGSGADLWMPTGGGVDLSFGGYRSTWLNGVVNFSDSIKSVSGGGASANLSYLTVTFGPRFIYRQKKYDAFGEALFGLGRVSMSANIPGYVNGSEGVNGFAWKVGGGMDFNISRRVAIRAPLVHWQQFKTQYFGGDAANFLSVGGGVVFRLK